MKAAALLCLRLALWTGFALGSVLPSKGQDVPGRFPNHDYFDSRAQRLPATGEGAVVRGLRPTRPRQPVAVSPQSLTTPWAGDPETAARAFLNETLGVAGVRAASGLDLPLAARYESRGAGLTHFVFQPSLGGAPYFDEEWQVHVGAGGRGWVFGRDGPPPVPTNFSAALTPQKAIEAAVGTLSPETKLELRAVAEQSGPDRRTVFSDPAFLSPALADLVWFSSHGATVPAWRLFLHLGPLQAYLAVVDGSTGGLLFSRNLILNAKLEGMVWRLPGRPNREANERTREPFTGWPASAGDCPAPVYPSHFRSGELKDRCWVAAAETAGNNVRACRDVDGNNLCDAHAAGNEAHFDFTFSDSYSQSGDPRPDRDAVLTNAFYWTNAAHDWLYELGFDEASGNLQADNFGRGGAENDALRLDVEDSAFPNNATFLATPDGIAPRMQLGLFSGLLRDSALDADIVIHEYVHALTTRLVGGPTNVASLFIWQSGAMAEGWSDACAASLTDDPVFGEYLFRNPASGIRSVAYDRSPYTFGQFGTLFLKVIPNTDGLVLALPQVHRDGEIWATVLWDLRQALGRNDFEQVVTTALKLTPSRPSMLDGRDALLQAAQAFDLGGPDGCLLWEVFAARGFGFSAALNPIEPNQKADTALSVFESFDVPAACGGTAPAVDEVLFDDNVESGLHGWTATGLWHRTSRRAASGAYSWWFGREQTGTYDTGGRAYGSLISAPIDLTGASAAMVEWDQFFQGEGFGSSVNLGSGNAAPYLNADSGRLLLSTDEGATWRTLTTLAHDSSSGEFDHYRVNLSRYAGQAVRLAFSFDTFDGTFNSHEGWHIDNIRVSRLAPPSIQLQVEPSVLAFSMPAGGPSPDPQNLTISYGGSEGLSWTASVAEGGSWLTVTPASGKGPATLAVSVDADGLSASEYAGSIRITSPGASGSPAAIHVTLTVGGSPGPAAAWLFEETGSGAGVLVEDASGNGHDGRTRSFGAIPLPGITGRARLFNGLTDHIEVSPSEALTPPSFTIRTWVRLLSYPQNFGIVLSAYGGNYRGWFLAVDAHGRVIFMAAQPPSSAPWVVSKTKLCLECWQSISVTFEAGNGLARIYIDGVLDTEAYVPGIEPETSLPLTIGRASWHNGYFLNFAIDETEIHPAVRSGAEVATDDAAFSPPGPAANPAVGLEWPFESGAEDVSGNEHHGTLFGSVAAPGVLGQARRFNGLGDAVTTPASHRLTPSSFTVQAWVKLASYPVNFGIVIADYGGDYQGWYVAVRSDGRVIFSINRLPASTQGAISNAALELDRWYHLAVTYDGRLQRAAIYIDGALDRQATVAGLTPQYGGFLSVGKASWHSGYYLDVTVDELRLQPGVLSAEEIAAELALGPGLAAALTRPPGW